MRTLGILLISASLLCAVSVQGQTTAERIHVRGMIIGVDLEHHVFGLKTDRGDVRIQVVERTKIFKNGEPARLADLFPGDLAKVEADRVGDRLVALTVMAYTPPRHEAVGTLAELARDGTFLLVTDRGRIPMFVNDRTEIYINGQKARFVDLRNGDKANVLFTSRKNDQGRHLALKVGVRR